MCSSQNTLFGKFLNPSQNTAIVISPAPGSNKVIVNDKSSTSNFVFLEFIVK